jgi:uncharacterized protein (TIGR02678 family)
MSQPSVTEARRMALHDLLDRILVHRLDEPEAYRRIWQHREWLAAWFEERPGWRLVSGRDLFRLERLPSRIPPERGLPRLRSPLAYAAVCWILWFAEELALSARSWFLASELANRIQEVSEGRFRLAERSHREALLQALALLEDLQVLQHKDGERERWLSGPSMGREVPELLFSFTEAAPRLVAHFPFELLAGTDQDPTSGRQLPLVADGCEPLGRAWRSLLLGPILWRGDDPEAFEALLAAEEVVATDLYESLGWTLQVHPEWAGIGRETTARGMGSNLIELFPELAPEGERHTRFLLHPLLLLLHEIQGEVEQGLLQPEADGALPLPLAKLRLLLASLKDQHGERWGSLVGQMGLGELTEAVLQELRRLGFLRGPDKLGDCWLLPPAALIGGEYRLSGGEGA